MSIYDESKQLKDCTLEHFVGAELGAGSFRRTYALARDPDLVLKIQFASGHHNVIEWETWQAAKGTRWERWFAPCVSIDSWGSALLMKRATPFDGDDDFLAAVKKVPPFFHDVKWTNWGMLDGRPVCIDYGHTLLFQQGMTAAGSRMKPTKPWLIP